jgi:3-methyladenine DNA glycosylase Tag
MSLRAFRKIEERVIERVGGKAALEKELTKPATATSIRNIPDDRYLSEFARCVFQAGFSWKVVDKKWPDFETVFSGFNLQFCAHLSEDAMDELLADPRIIRNWMKVKTVRHNAAFLIELSEEYGSVGQYFATWKSEQFFENIAFLVKHGQRLGGMTAQIAMRRLGIDSMMLTPDVIAALIREEVVDKAPKSKTAQKSVQAAVNEWMNDSGRSLNEVSKILALSVG